MSPFDAQKLSTEIWYFIGQQASNDSLNEVMKLIEET